MAINTCLVYKLQHDDIVKPIYYYFVTLNTEAMAKHRGPNILMYFSDSLQPPFAQISQ